MKNIVIFLFIIGIVAACPPEQDFKLELKKGLFNYLQNPAESKLTIYEVKDLLQTYLTTDISTADCTTITGTESGMTLNTILQKTAGIPMTTIPSCSDGTMYGECSENKPKFCHSGMLRIMCNGPDLVAGNEDDCGCPEYQYCESDGSCSSSPIDCYSDTDCGTSQFTGNATCVGNEAHQNYINFTCNYPATPSSYCSFENQDKIIMICATCLNGACI